MQNDDLPSSHEVPSLVQPTGLRPKTASKTIEKKKKTSL